MAIADPTPIPRTIQPSDRAPAGLKRFKVTSKVTPSCPEYVLANDSESAANHYHAKHRPDVAVADYHVVALED